MLKTEMPLPENLIESGDAWLRAGEKYREEFAKTVPHSNNAVVWLQDTDGDLVIYTRGEYTQQLKELISTFDGFL